MLLAWIAFPLTLGLLSLGCGLLLEQLSGLELRNGLLAPAGFAVVIVLASFTTISEATAPLTVPVVVAATVAGFGLSFPLHVRQVNRWAAATAVGIFAVYAAPVVLSGQATFAGYLTLDDTSTWLAMTDRVMEHGRSLSTLEPSTYRTVLNDYLGSGSPVGANLPLGIGGKLVGYDIAWLFQPYIAFVGAMLSLGIYGLVRPLVTSRALRAAVAFVAAQPALLYAYSVWSGFKEVTAAALLVLLAALVTPLLTEDRNPLRRALPLATASGALVAVLTVGGAAWLAALFVPALGIGLWTRGRAFAPSAVAFTVLVLALAIPSLVSASVFLRHVTDTHVFTSGAELGNLIRPLRRLQLFGIWPTGDFRTSPSHPHVTDVLIGLVIVAAGLGLARAWLSRAWGLLLYVTTIVVGYLAISISGSPWVTAKALATGSPAFLTASLCGTAWIFQRGRKVEATVVAALIAGGVLWSNVLIYHDVWLAPRSQLAELQQIGERFAGQGPTLMTEYQTYGTRHFLRSMDPEGAGERRWRPIPLRNGQSVLKGGYADIDELQFDAVFVYRTLVLLRSPFASRPPSPYNLAWEGRFYEVWQRSEGGGPQVLEHVSLGTETQPAVVPACAEVMRVAEVAGSAGGRLAAVVREEPSVVDLSRTAYSPTWETTADDPALVYPYGGGTLDTAVRLSDPGRYGVWLGGSFRRRVEISIDGRSVGSARHQINHPGAYTPFGSLALSAGVHGVSLRYSDSDLRPGSGGAPLGMGPLVLSRQTADLPVTYVRPAAARELCGKRLDWIEALGP